MQCHNSQRCANNKLKSIESFIHDYKCMQYIIVSGSNKFVIVFVCSLQVFVFFIHDSFVLIVNSAWQYSPHRLYFVDPFLSDRIGSDHTCNERLYELPLKFLYSWISSGQNMLRTTITIITPQWHLNEWKTSIYLLLTIRNNICMRIYPQIYTAGRDLLSFICPNKPIILFICVQSNVQLHCSNCTHKCVLEFMYLPHIKLSDLFSVCSILSCLMCTYTRERAHTMLKA